MMVEEAKIKQLGEWLPAGAGPHCPVPPPGPRKGAERWREGENQRSVLKTGECMRLVGTWNEPAPGEW